ncbi:MAG TPA: M14-type cytosolic carboxypeptidase [Sphingomonas sp.]|jgi:murein tripeptide amidase MpaA
MSLSINAAFDGGNIRVVATEGDRVDLEIVRDAGSDFYQWFHFRVAGAQGRRLTFRILNAGGSAYPFGWPGYKVRASTDREAWRQVADTSYAEGVLAWTWEADAELAWFAYFAPYPMERHDALVARIAARPGVRHRELGTSLDGHAIDALTIGSGPKPVWVYARQHPGEPMAEWFMEGVLERLTDGADPHTARLLAAATVHCVPNMNPDGSRRGHLRTNAAGVNLNREWHAPTPERSPEVLCVRDAMDETGVVFAIDVHGDEAIPANFIAGYEGIPSWSDDHGAHFYEFGRRLAAHTPDFQTERGYEKAKSGQANLSMSTNQLAERYRAVACTLEMPFKDHDPNPDPEFGWSPERCKTLAHACVEVLSEMIDDLPVHPSPIGGVRVGHAPGTT